jgi:hypothetical protein
MAKKNLNEEVKPGLYFNLADGRTIKSVSELVDALKNMEEWVFEHHVSSQRNDFSNWIRDVYQDKKLATAVKKAKKRKTAIKKLEKVLKKNFKKSQKQEKQQEKERKKAEKQEKEQQKEKSKVKKIESPKEKKSILNLLKRLR